MTPKAQLCGPDAQLNGAQPVAARAAGPKMAHFLRLQVYPELGSAMFCLCTRSDEWSACCCGSCGRILWEIGRQDSSTTIRQLLEGCSCVGESRSGLMMLDSGSQPDFGKPKAGRAAVVQPDGLPSQAVPCPGAWMR